MNRHSVVEAIGGQPPYLKVDILFDGFLIENERTSLGDAFIRLEKSHLCMWRDLMCSLILECMDLAESGLGFTLAGSSQPSLL